MRYRYLGDTGLRVSELCLGTTNFGATVPLDTARVLLAKCIDVGINFFDTADAAVESEVALGKLLDNRRHSVVIATKVFRPTGKGPNDAGLSKKHIVKACEDSLRRLQTDFIDLYQSHSDDVCTPLEETLAAFDQLVRQGKVLYIGASNYTAWRMVDALWISRLRGFASFASVQGLCNLLERSVEADVLPMCRNKQTGFVAWSALANGVLARAHSRKGMPTDKAKVLDVLFDIAQKVSRPPTQIALRWLLNRPGVTAAAFGVSSLAQLEENLGVTSFNLSSEDAHSLDEVSKPFIPYPANMETLVRELRS